MPVCAVVGAQYGSEGKGVIVHHIAREYDIHVRTGGPNAGHTFIEKDIKFKMQMLPVGWVNPNATLVIGRGAVVDLEILDKEIALVKKYMDLDVAPRVWIDSRAAILERRHREEEGGVRGSLHRSIGSTGEGVGAVRRDRLSRELGECSFVTDVSDWGKYAELSRCVIGDTSAMMELRLKGGENVLLEGTQGTGLSLIHGYWPYVTSTDTTAAALLADAGVAPFWLTQVILVARTMPIRVAGNSGPLLGEVTWGELSNKLDREVMEHTTVTKKVRRIGIWDDELFLMAVRLNRPTTLAITFLDYLNSSNIGVEKYDGLDREARSFVQYVERMGGAHATFLGTGGPNFTIIDRRY